MRYLILYMPQGVQSETHLTYKSAIFLTMLLIKMPIEINNCFNSTQWIWIILFIHIGMRSLR
jgi:hypothetical protein